MKVQEFENKDRFYVVHRLPIIQGSSFAFVFPTISLMLLPRNLCPDPLEPGPSASINFTNSSSAPTATTTSPHNVVESGPPMQMYNDTDGRIVDSDELWMSRMNEVCCSHGIF